MSYYTVVYKQDLVWHKYGITTVKELAQTWKGALFNNKRFINQGVKTIRTLDYPMTKQGGYILTFEALAAIQEAL